MDTRPHIQVVVQNYSSHFTIQALYFEQTINQNNAMKRCSGDKVDCGIVFVCTAKKATHANQAHNTLHIAQTYLIFVIFFTPVKFLENKIYTEKRQFFALNL